jgi:long-subunit fatty acid transport protein
MQRSISPRPPTQLATSLLAVLSVLSVSSVASASGLDAPMVGSGQSGPTTRDGAAIHWNPANLAYMKKGEFFGGLMLVVGDIRYQRNYTSNYQTPDTLEFKAPISPENISGAKSGYGPEAKANPIAPLGNIFIVLPPIKKRLVFGLGLYVPYGAPLKFPRNGPQAFQLQQAFIVASHITASAGFKINDYVSLGAGVSYVSASPSSPSCRTSARSRSSRTASRSSARPTTSGPTPRPTSASWAPWRARSPSRRRSPTASPSTSASPSTRPRNSRSP